MPKFNWEINLGHVLTIGAILITMATAYTTYQVTIQDHESRLRALEKGSTYLGSQIETISSNVYAVKYDLAVIRYQLEHGKKSEVPGR